MDRMHPKARLVSLLVVAGLITVAGVFLPSHQSMIEFYALPAPAVAQNAQVAAVAASSFAGTLQYVIAGAMS